MSCCAVWESPALLAPLGTPKLDDGGRLAAADYSAFTIGAVGGPRYRATLVFCTRSIQVPQVESPRGPQHTLGSG